MQVSKSMSRPSPKVAKAEEIVGANEKKTQKINTGENLSKINLFIFLIKVNIKQSN